jgi:hypothetical protein
MAQVKFDRAVELEGADRERMARLYEEVTGNVQQMATIMGRKLHMPGTWSEVTIRVSQGSAAGDVDEDEIEVELVVNPETGETGCYDYVDNICVPC